MASSSIRSLLLDRSLVLLSAQAQARLFDNNVVRLTAQKAPCRFLSLSSPWGAVNTINSFMMCIDSGDSNKFKSLFVPDGHCIVKKTNFVASGHLELESFCTMLHHRFKDCVHLESNVTLCMGSDPKVISCTNESYWQAIAKGKIISMGIHKDILEKQANGNWLFRERIILHTWSKDEQ
jgi:hypothetical protein